MQIGLVELACTSHRPCQSVPPSHDEGLVSFATPFMPRLPRADQPPSGLILAARIPLPHFSVSSTMSLPKAVGEPISGVSPKSVRCAFSFGVARPALISALSLSTTCVDGLVGVPAREQIVYCLILTREREP